MATFELREAARLWRDRQGRFARHMGTGTERLRQSVEQMAKASLLRLIYSKPEDVSPTGRKLWTRTEALLQSEKAVMGATGEVRLTNEQVYARRRHELGGPEEPVAKPGWDRRAPWRTAIQEDLRREQLAQYEAALLEALEAV